MKVAEIQFAPWDKTYYFSLNDIEVSKGDYVVVKTEMGTEIGTVSGFSDLDDKCFACFNADAVPDNGSGEPIKKAIKPILRKAAQSDLDKIPSDQEKRQALEYCKRTKEKYGLEMKFIDAHYAFDGSRVTFAFIADGRVDFRELVKDLTRHFGRTIRLQQIGIRDEAKVMGDYGHCGKKLCCKGHLKELASITSDMAELQQCSHRGSDRISGICGRLMCCLAYEESGYEEMLAKLPPMGAKVNVDGKRGVVVGHHVLKQSVDVEFRDKNGENPTFVEVDLNRHKKKNNVKKR
jgi:cell fate regulator YaaT (PSP1 superfamily)